jgi:hypothetical protein
VAEADAFLADDHWQVGTWEIRDAIHAVDLPLRPDGYYIAKESTEFLNGLVRGRYALDGRRIRLTPFVGQGIYARSNGEFGLVERTRELDYYGAELREAMTTACIRPMWRPGGSCPTRDSSPCRPTSSTSMPTR